MKPAFHILGNPPEHWQEALAELSGDLGIALSAGGIEVTCRRADALSVESDGRAVTLTWAEPVQFYRALSLIPLPLTPCSIRERARFQSSGIMLDCSRNAVPTVGALRRLLRAMALMGLNLGMLYTEDTYEVPGEPFFGYKRGRYTFDELKALDDYANLFGIELCPCIQTLGHLKRMLHWPAYYRVRDNDEVLLADSEETYVLLDKMIRAASAPYRSKRIHLGMDEAYGVGLGKHLSRYGYEDPHSIIGRHLTRVLGICQRYGLNAMMWSDMYFHLDGKDYHSPGLPSRKAREAVDPRVTLVYWDYFQSREEMYADALHKHAQLPAPTVFAGGIWTWIGPAPDYPATFANTTAALAACAKAGVPLVFATAWGDNGAECNLAAVLPGLQLYGELTYRDSCTREQLAQRFRRCCHGELEAFLDLSLLNYMPGMKDNPSDPVNACKFMLYQDPLIQLFEADTRGYAMAEHFGALVTRYARSAAENPEYGLFFDFYAALANALALKCQWHEQAGEAVRSRSRERAAALAEGIPATVEALNTLRAVWRRLWESTNKPNGFEIIEVRLGGIAARMSTAGEKMRAFALGEVQTIPELEEEALITKRRPGGSIICTNTMDEIATPGRIDY